MSRNYGIDVPILQKGTKGIGNATAIFGNPKRVFFTIQTAWGDKRFTVAVYPGEVE